MSTLIIDIETIGHDFDSFDKATQENLTWWIRNESSSEEEYQSELQKLKEGLGFSPLTGEVVAIGVLDYEKQQGVVYYQAPGSSEVEKTDGAITYKPMSEATMLESFWKGALQYKTFVTFNGRQFDLPFLMTRSAVHSCRPTKDLLRNRYVQYGAPDAIHIDLYDQLSFYGAARYKARSLHMYTRAFGIKSPKEDGMTGDQVGEFFKQKKFKEIAEYNAGDLFATSALYKKWQDYLRF